MPLKSLGVDHVGVAVADLEKATTTYRDLLGFEIAGGETLETRGLAVRFVTVGDSRIELIAPTRADSEVSRFLAKNGEGLHHVAVRVHDLDAALRDLKARGAKLIDETPRPGAHQTRVAFVHPKGAHGVLLELVEHRREPPT
ncbi:MAG: methylmalonyl-CoA epimerase [Deltaproteobacteria bacterium]|nr:methylmalonyl-CoA epimerase [Deltaproteobacteria bacterium]